MQLLLFPNLSIITVFSFLHYNANLITYSAMIRCHTLRAGSTVKVLKYKNCTTLISGNICHSLLEHNMTENTEFFNIELSRTEHCKVDSIFACQAAAMSLTVGRAVQ